MLIYTECVLGWWPDQAAPIVVTGVIKNKKNEKNRRAVFFLGSCVGQSVEG